MIDILNKDKSHIILLTASIDPHGMPDSPFGAEKRERQYINALKFYARKYQHSNINIIFIDNSNWDLTVIKAAVEEFDNIQFISQNINNYPRHYGKGYGELSMILDSLDHPLIDSSTMIIKITGRLKILNLDAILKQLDLSTRLLCDARSVHLKFWEKRHMSQYVDTRLIIFEKELFKVMMAPIQNKIDKSRGYHLESLLYSISHIHKSGDGIIRRFNAEPKYSGYGAHAGGKNYDSQMANIEWLLRNGLRKVLPFTEF